MQFGYALICSCEDHVKNHLSNNEDIFYYFIVDSLIRPRGKKWKIKETAGRNFHTNQFLCRWKTINSKFINRFLTKSLWKKANKTYRTGDTRKQIFLLIHLTCGDYPCNLVLILETKLWAWASKYLRIKLFKLNQYLKLYW